MIMLATLPRWSKSLTSLPRFQRMTFTNSPTTRRRCLGVLSVAHIPPQVASAKIKPWGRPQSRLFSTAVNETTGTRANSDVDATGTLPTTGGATTSTKTNNTSHTSLYPEFPSELYYLPPGPSTITPRKNQRIIFIGDVHGDLPALCSFLTTAGLLDPNSTVSSPIWSGKDTICIQVGDILDRGDEELVSFRLMTSLARQAQEQGGCVRLLHGNHEAMNALGLFQYAESGGNAEFEKDVGQKIDLYRSNQRWRLQYAGNEPARWVVCEPGGLLCNTLFGNMDVALVVGRTVVAHAGLTAAHLREWGGIEGMNKAASEWWRSVPHGENDDEGSFTTVEEVLAAAQNRATLASKTIPGCLNGGLGDPSPIWMRDYSSPHDAAPNNPRAQAMIDEMLEVVGGGAQRLVMGHTPQSQINAALKGKAWRIDVGASKGVMSGVPEVLEIIHGGDDEEDVINILSAKGDRIKGSERQVIENII
eukprot:CAMPEP_0172488274 /NCGR_PEP_ID=MMETSP1066-20121228/17727_1 /TAXON_ID=671091 /ORGANISM="Coscinodiscus wailesii, Strain CCMP2513" /LENGTH=475 /DNA_ID=CAMNT_0013255395 /DNA_START=138 /DNA_END=1565 /DNA_ORIENTATION=-